MTHLKWAEGGVETEDALLPYPKKVTRSATVVQSTLPPASCRDSAESISAEAVPASAVSHERDEDSDAWASYDAEESEAFWRNSSTRSSHAVNEQTWTGESVASVEMPPIMSTAKNTAYTTSDVGDSRHSSSGSSCAVSKQTCSESSENTSDRTFDSDKNDLLSMSRSIPGVIDKVKLETTHSLTAEKENMRSLSTNTRGDTLVLAEDSCDRDLSYSVADAVSAAVSSETEYAKYQIEESSPNVDEFVHNSDNSSSGGSTSGANMFLATENVCCDHSKCDEACTASSCHIGSSVLAEDDTNGNAARESDGDISVDYRCVDKDSDADTHVVDDTEDSDVDENFFTSWPLWQTAMKRDPYPMKEPLLLTLEEVICDKNNIQADH